MQLLYHPIVGWLINVYHRKNPMKKWMDLLKTAKIFWRHQDDISHHHPYPGARPDLCTRMFSGFRSLAIWGWHACFWMGYSKHPPLWKEQKSWKPGIDIDENLILAMEHDGTMCELGICHGIEWMQVQWMKYNFCPPWPYGALSESGGRDIP